MSKIMSKKMRPLQVGTALAFIRHETARHAAAMAAAKTSAARLELREKLRAARKEWAKGIARSLNGDSIPLYDRATGGYYPPLRLSASQTADEFRRATKWLFAS